jgi:hypothetical protein
VVALDEDLIATADAHHLVAKIVVTDGGACRAHRDDSNKGYSNQPPESRKLQH